MLVKNPYVKFILKGQGSFSLDVNKIIRLQVTLNLRYTKNVIRYSFFRIFAEGRESHVSQTNRVFLSAVYNRTAVLVYKIEHKLQSSIKGCLTSLLLHMGSPKVLYLELYFFFCTSMIYTPAQTNLTFICLLTTSIFSTPIRILSPLKMS